MTSRSAHDAARRSLDRLGAHGTDEVVREGASLLVRRGEVVVRVRPTADRPVADREVALAHRLVADGVPVVAPAGDGRPWEVGDQVVTAWRWVPAVRPAGPADLGALVAALRERTADGGAAGLGPFDPIGHILDAVGPCGDDADVCFVRDQAERLRPRYEAAAAGEVQGVVVHGDLHADNVVVGVDGPMLLDLELGGWGPSAYDVAPAVVAVDRYRAPADGLDRFLAAAGHDPRGSEGFDVLVAVYELWVTAWAVSVAHRRPDWAAEAAVRVATLRDGATGTWHLS